eukprot:10075210-Alexandrium_andersonii.AAC.1
MCIRDRCGITPAIGGSAGPVTLPASGGGREAVVQDHRPFLNGRSERVSVNECTSFPVSLTDRRVE